MFFLQMFSNHLPRLPYVHGMSLGLVLVALVYLLVGVQAKQPAA